MRFSKPVTRLLAPVLLAGLAGLAGLATGCGAAGGDGGYPGLLGSQIVGMEVRLYDYAAYHRESGSFIAYARTADGFYLDYTNKVLWESNSPNVQIDKISGQATFNNLGHATIQAYYSSSLHASCDCKVLGHLYAVQSGSNQVAKIDHNGLIKNLSLFGLTGMAGLAVDQAGNFYAGSDASSTVHQFTHDGVDQGTYGGSYPLPSGLAFDASGNLYESDASDGGVLTTTPARATSTFFLGLTVASSVAVDSAGNVFTTDSFSNKVVKYNAAGVSQGDFATGLNTPVALAIDSQDNVYVACSGSNTVNKFDKLGTALGTVGTGLNQPKGLAVDPDNNVYISNTGTNSIVKVTVDGTTTTFTTGLSTPQHLIYD